MNKPTDPFEKPKFDLLDYVGLIPAVMAALLLLGFFFLSYARAEEFSNDQIADAIFKAENSKAHPYGILGHWHKPPRVICLNTIAHARRDWDGKGDFIAFLGSRYAPTKNCANDPRGLNRNWTKNVKYFLSKGKNNANT